jgi:rRNA-processing protein FCF1
MIRSPFAAIEVLLIDGNNLLYRLSGSAGDGALRGLLPRLAVVIPANISTTVMLDGHAAMGSGRVQTIRNGLEVRHAGSHTADDALFNIVRDTPLGSRATTTVVTDDRALTERIRHLGAHTVRLAWLEGVLTQRPQVGVALGNRRPRRDRP